MKTDDLVSLLATGVEPIDARRMTRRYALAITGGILGALAITGGILHFNRTLSREVFEPMFWIRGAYCAALGSLGLAAIARLARPGVRLGFVPARIRAVVTPMWRLGVLLLSMDSSAASWVTGR